jgi:DNA polymerase III subunit gamma/tau
MSQALYRKWRPHLWEQVVGQEHIVRTLQNAIRSERVGHAYLFAGPRGTGKTTTARLLAKAVNCLNPDPAKRPCDACAHCLAVNEGRFLDLIEIDAASNTSVDDIRDLRDKINFSPSQGSFKVYIIDEVHMLSTAAFNALLKTLEEPPSHAIFILATTESHKIPATVLSRCQRHEFRRIPIHDIVRQLQTIIAGENMAADPEALVVIARQATGGMRDAISLLDQLSSTGEKITLELTQSVLGTATNQTVVELVEAVLARQPGTGLDCIHRALDGGTDPRQFARQIVDYLRGLMLVKMGNAAQIDATAETRAQMARHASGFALPALLEAVRLFNTAASDTRGGWQPSLLLELALAETMEEKPASRQEFETQALSSSPRPEPAPAAAERPASNHTETQGARGPAAAVKQPAKQPEADTSRRPYSPGSSEVKSDPPSAQPQPPTVNPPQSGAREPGEISFNDITQNWARIRALLKKQKAAQTEALLNSGKPMILKDGTLIIGFATEVLKQKMEMGEHIKLTRAAIGQVVGADLPVRCVVMNAKAGQLPDDMDVEGDGMVGTALNLGAEIVHKE